MTEIQILLLVTAVMGGIFVFVPLFAHWYSFKGIRSKTVGDGQHGTARWAENGSVWYSTKRASESTLGINSTLMPRGLFFGLLRINF